MGVMVSGSEHRTVTERCDAQAPSPSKAESVMVAAPTLAQVNVGVADVGSDRVPDEVVQL